ncbi:ORC4 Origin recognition complex subunit 4 [Candida maltosa Xu316]
MKLAHSNESTATPTEEETDVIALENISEHDVEIVKSQIIRQLNGNFENLLKEPTLLEKYEEIRTTFERTVVDKESHSVIILGPRSSGKTSIVTKALNDLEKSHKNEFFPIYLNSCVQVDDKAALREIARQLDVKVKEDDSDYEDDEEEGSAPKKQVSFANFEAKSIHQTFANILSVLYANKYDNEDRMPLIFVIDEFENFAIDNTQTLLYNLLDLSQNSESPICVVGLTTKMTAKESLEKRVNSRFSQRVISLVYENSLESFWNSAKLNLELDKSVIDKLDNRAYGLEWNKHITRLYNKENSLLKKIVLRNYYTVKDHKKLNNECRVPVSKLCPEFPLIRDEYFKLTDQGDGGVQGLIGSLSDLELLLVIASARWIEKYDINSINFNLAYKEYQDMIKDSNIDQSAASTTFLESRFTSNIRVHQKVWSKKVLSNSWGSLYKLGILLDPRNDTTDKRGYNYSHNISKNLIVEENQMVLLDVTLDELNGILYDQHTFKKFVRL